MPHNPSTSQLEPILNRINLSSQRKEARIMFLKRELSKSKPPGMTSTRGFRSYWPNNFNLSKNVSPLKSCTNNETYIHFRNTVNCQDFTRYFRLIIFILFNRVQARDSKGSCLRPMHIWYRDTVCSGNEVALFCLLLLLDITKHGK